MFRWFVFAFFFLIVVGCGDGGPEGNTQLSAHAVSGRLPMVETVEYSVHCEGDDLDTPRNGDLDVVATNSIQGNTGNWEGDVDLPPGLCLIRLSGRDANGEVICKAEAVFTVVAKSTTQVEVLLDCASDFVPPREMPSNACPDLFLLQCADPEPPAPALCQVRFDDHDNTCGPGCDPQICNETAEGLFCTPGPDPGVSTTVTCPNAELDCTGDGTQDPSCLMYSGTLGDDFVGGPTPCSTAIDCGVPGAICTGGLCEFVPASPTLNANFFVTCPPDSGSEATIECIAITTDGDVDCDMTRIVVLECPAAAAE